MHPSRSGAPHISMNLFTKPTDMHQYLLPSSHHPPRPQEPAIRLSTTHPLHRQRPRRTGQKVCRAGSVFAKLTVPRNTHKATENRRQFATSPARKSYKPAYRTAMQTGCPLFARGVNNCLHRATWSTDPSQSFKQTPGCGNLLNGRLSCTAGLRTCGTCWSGLGRREQTAAKQLVPSPAVQPGAKLAR